MICKKLFERSLLGLFFLVLAVSVALAADKSHVILISIDGFAAYHLENEELELPNIRALALRGVWAESGETVFPSVTHPSHATIITGVSPRVHGVIRNRVRNRETGESFHISEKSRAELIEVSTLFDAAKKKGLTTTAMFWPETKGDSSLDFNIIHEHRPPRYEKGQLDPSIAKPEFLEELRAAGISIDLYFEWYSDFALKGARDIILAQATGYVIRKHKPELVATLISVTDSRQHRYGPDHYLSKAALTTADHCVGILRQAVRDAGIEDETTFIITADHGFHSVKYDVNLHPLLSDVALAEKVTLHEDAWTMFVELTESFDPAQDPPSLERFLQKAVQLEGVSKIVRPEQFHDLGTRRYEEDPHVPGHYMVIADIDTHLVSDASNPSTKRYRKKEISHGHGYLPSHPRMYPVFVISGHRIKRGERIGHIRNHDIAPTIAHLLDLEMKDVEGRVLKEVLAE
ncbi:ectonucleotide pyrophosphatase/phosphodiesterase [Acidobacteria bacterium AH-259-A15]|nr:ectonucleotide pyrophosphatase/phosphodiesterase [Acidobacteria bacterium AH-259-A15]